MSLADQSDPEGQTSVPLLRWAEIITEDYYTDKDTGHTHTVNDVWE